MRAWIARDENGELFLYTEYPNRYAHNFGVYRSWEALRLDPSEYPELRWEDEPKEVEFTIGPYEYYRRD